MSGGTSLPVLVTMFNRPDHAARVIAAVARVRPKQIFLAVDGPRAGITTDPSAVDGCRGLVSAIDWDCEVKTRFREENMGCREGMIDAVSWFFEHVEEGVVLEDDCLPTEGFFVFASAVFDAHRADPRLMQLSGYGHVVNPSGSVYFLPLTSSWGWGSTGKVWREFVRQREGLAADFEAHPELHSRFDLDDAYPYSQMFRRNIRNKVSSWAILFYWFVFRSEGLVAYPAQSLIRNFGFDGSGTHGDHQPGIEADLLPAAGEEIRVPGTMAVDESLFAEVRRCVRPKGANSDQGKENKAVKVSLIDKILKRLVKRGLRLVAAEEKNRALKGRKNDHIVKEKEKRRVPYGVSVAKTTVIHESAVFRHLSRNPDAIRLGSFTHLRGELLTYWNGGEIEIGSNCYVGEGTRIWSQVSIRIGNDVLISHLVDIHDTDGHPINADDRVLDGRFILQGKGYLTPTRTVSAPIVIGDRVWIGFKASILKGVKIGEGAIIAAGSVVTRDVPPYTVVAGNPAVVVREGIDTSSKG